MIDFSKDFRWIDDYVMESEKTILKEKDCENKQILVNLTDEPDQLKYIMKILELSEPNILDIIKANYLLNSEDLKNADIKSCLDKLTLTLLEQARKIVNNNFTEYIGTSSEEEKIKLLCLQYFFAIILLTSCGSEATSSGVKVNLRKKIIEHNNAESLLQITNNLDFCMGSCGIEAQNSVISKKL